MARKLYCVLLFAGLLAVAAAIFAFSGQSKEESVGVSSRLALVVIEAVDPDFHLRPAQEQQSVLSFADKLLRKFAHFLEYAALGFFLRLLAGCFRLKLPTRLSWLAGTLYACTDELHQLFSYQRNAQWQDVLLDSAGVLAGITVAYACMVLAVRWKTRHQQSDVD